MKLSELEEGCTLNIRVRANSQTLMLPAVLKKNVREDAILITLTGDTAKRYSFENVATDMEYSKEGDLPVIWHNVRVIAYKTDYLIQVFGDGTKYNRRNSFRVGVSEQAYVKTREAGLPSTVMMKDVSLTGFSVSDRKNELSMQIGDNLAVAWEDNGHHLNLAGRLVRIEEQDGYKIYGFEITNVCKDLSSYISVKQRRR